MWPSNRDNVSFKDVLSLNLSKDSLRLDPVSEGNDVSRRVPLVYRPKALSTGGDRRSDGNKVRKDARFLDIRGDRNLDRGGGLRL